MPSIQDIIGAVEATKAAAVTRAKQNVAAYLARNKAQSNLNQQLATSIKQKQQGQGALPVDPELGITSAKFSSLDPNEQRYVAGTAGMAIGGLTGGLKSSGLKDTQFARALSSQRASELADDVIIQAGDEAIDTTGRANPQDFITRFDGGRVASDAQPTKGDISQPTNSANSKKNTTSQLS